MILPKIIRLPKSNRVVVDVPPTGFTSTDNRDKATKFYDEQTAHRYCVDRGIFNYDLVDYFKMPVLTRFEKFCWDNGDRSSSALATETNRTEAAVCAAYNRAHNKMRDLEVLKGLGKVAA